MVTKKEMTIFITLLLIGSIIAGIGIDSIGFSGPKAEILIGIAAIILGITRYTIGEKIYSKCIIDYKGFRKN